MLFLSPFISRKALMILSFHCLWKSLMKIRKIMFITTGLSNQGNFQIEVKELPVQPKLKMLEIEFRHLNA